MARNDGKFKELVDRVQNFIPKSSIYQLNQGRLQLVSCDSPMNIFYVSNQHAELRDVLLHSRFRSGEPENNVETFVLKRLESMLNTIKFLRVEDINEYDC